MANVRGKPITDTLGELEGGDFIAEATEKLYNLTVAVLDTRKPGSLTIKLALKPNAKGMVEIDAKIDTNEPKEDRPSTNFFVSSDGALLRNDPRQHRLPLSEVPRDESEPIKVNR